MSRPLRALLLFALLPLAACSPSNPSAESPSATEVTAADLTGRELTLKAPAAKVVCLDGTCIDALAELGLEPVASVQMAQVTSPLFFGPDAATTPLGGTFFEPDVEGIIAAQPDLVIGSATVHSALSDALGDIPLYLNSISERTDAPANLRAIAALTGRSEQATPAIARYEKTLAAYTPKQRPTTVLSMYGGATSDIGIDALDSAIGSLLAEYTAYPWPAASEGESGFLEIGLETILATDPAHIWVLDFGFDPKAKPLLEQLDADPLWRQLAAVKSGSVHLADSAWWGTTGGTRGQQAILDTVLPAVYPDEFPRPLSGLPTTP